MTVVKKNNLNQGFTLLELMIAAAILVIAICGLLVTFVACLLSNEAKSNLIMAANDAQYVLEQIENLPYEQIDDYPENPEFNNLRDEYITVTQDPEYKITGVTINVSWTERGGTKNFQLSTRIAR